MTLQHRMRGLRVGNFEYVPEALELGRLAGNRFQLLMRACQPLAPEGTASGTAMDEDSAEELEEEVGVHWIFPRVNHATGLT
jgi:tRNA(Glu) U13 pseudouridine synthase TruD